MAARVREALARIKSTVEWFESQSDEALLNVLEGLEEQADMIEDGRRVLTEKLEGRSDDEDEA